MKNKIKAVEVDGEKFFVKKDAFGYRIVNPIKNEDGSMNWFNFLAGGKRGLFNLIAIAVIFVLMFYGFQQVTSECSQLAKDPCNYCQDGLNKQLGDSLNGFENKLFININENEGVILNENPKEE